MAKKTKRQRRKKQEKQATLSPLACRNQGIQLVEKGDYKAGIIFLEKAIKNNRQDQKLKESLSGAYNKIILDYTHIGDYKKAEAILIKQLKVLDDNLDAWLAIKIFLYNKKYKEGLSIYTKHHQGLKNSIKTNKLLSQFIFYIFSNFNNLPESFQQTTFYKESKYAYQLFQKVLVNEPIEEEDIKKIGFLGPYKDLRILLRSFLEIKVCGKPSKFLIPIKKTSVFYEISTVLRAAVHEKSLSTITLLRSLSAAGLMLFKEIKGLNSEEYKLLKRLLLSHCDDRSNGIFRILIKYFPLFQENGSDLLKGQLWCVSNGHEQYKNVFEALPKLEQLKYHALWHESMHRYCDQAKKSWKDLACFYKKDKKNGKKASLVLLHLAEHYAENDTEKVDYYRDAIDQNSQDATAHLLLIKEKIRRHGLSSAVVAQSIKKAIKTVEEPTVLMELLTKNNYERGAYKEAVKTSQTVLKLHPSNKICRSIIGKSSLHISLKNARLGNYAKIEKNYHLISEYLSNKDKSIFQALIMIGKIFVRHLIPKKNTHNIKELSSGFSILAFVIQGILLGHSVDKQKKTIPVLEDKLAAVLESLDTFREVLSCFRKELSQKNYKDIFYLISKALKTKNLECYALLRFGFLLEDLGFKKIIDTYAKYFNGSTKEIIAIRIYYHSLKNKGSTNCAKITIALDQLKEARKNLSNNHILSHRIDFLMNNLIQRLPRPPMLFPREMRSLFEGIDFT